MNFENERESIISKDKVQWANEDLPEREPEPQNRHNPIDGEVFEDNCGLIHEI